MKFTMEVKVGKNLLSITEDCKDTKELFKKAGFYGTIPSQCGNPECNGDNLMLNHRKPQGKYDYYSVDCKDCGFRLNYGINQNEDETLFAKLTDGWQPPYQGEGEENAPKKSAKKSGTSALAKAKAKKKAQVEEEDEEDVYENSPNVEAEVEEEETAKPAAKKKSRKDLLSKFGKKKTA